MTSLTTPGWITVFAWLATAAVGPFIVGSQIQGLAVLIYPDYAPKSWHATLIMWAIMVLPVLANIWGRKLIKPIELVAGVVHLVGWPIVVGTLLACAPTRSPKEFVFETFVSGLSGWTNSGVVFSVGLLTPTFAMAGFDGMLHLSEEVTKPKTTVPYAMLGGFVFNGLLAFGSLLTILYTMGDLAAALTTPTGWPILEIYFQATNSYVGTSCLAAITFVIGFVAFFGALASTSRLVWAFARDNGLPGSRYFSHVSSTMTFATLNHA